MKKHRKFILGMLVAVLVVGLFQVGTAYAVACFSDIGGLPSAFQDAICWMKDNGVTSGYPDGTYRPDGLVTRAQMALFMKNQANVPPATGLILITPGNSEWQKFNSTSNINFTNFSTYTSAAKETTGSAFVTMQPSIPTVLYGRNLQLVGVEFCYSASANAVLSYVEINTFTSTNGAGTRTLQFSDSTDYTNTACNYYVLPAPVTLTSENGVSFYAEVNWAVAASSFQLSRTTFVLQPTGTVAVAPSSLSENVIPLSESSNGADSPSTSAP